MSTKTRYGLYCHCTKITVLKTQNNLLPVSVKQEAKIHIRFISVRIGIHGRAGNTV